MPDYPIRLSVQLDEETARELEAIAQELDRPVAWVIRQAVQEYVRTRRERPPSR